MKTNKKKANKKKRVEERKEKKRKKSKKKNTKTSFDILPSLLMGNSFMAYKFSEFSFCTWYTVPNAPLPST